jgi:hypothetical protein
MKADFKIRHHCGRRSIGLAVRYYGSRAIVDV